MSDHLSTKSWWKGGSFTLTDSLKKTAAALSEQFNIKIDIRPWEDAVAHSNTKDQTITIGTKGIYSYGVDYYVGLLLHEIAHIRYTPHHDSDVIKPIKKFKNPYVAYQMYNMIEDRRIDERMKDEYPGAYHFFRSLYDQSGEDVAVSLSLRPPTHFSRIAEFIQNEIQSRKVNGPQEAKQIENECKEYLLFRTCGLAFMVAMGRVDATMSTGVDECDQMANTVASELLEATDANKTDEEMVELTFSVLSTVDPLIPEEQYSKEQHQKEMQQQQQRQQQSQGNGQGQGDGDADDGSSMAGGHVHGHEHDVKGLLEKMAYSAPPGRSSQPFQNHIYNQYTRADERMRGMGETLKRKLVSVMRDNDHQRFEGNKRRGQLHKKIINRIAAGRYRVYQQRIEKKGKKYAVAIVEDCSGSMFSGATGGPSEHAHAAVALFTRVFRALGFPSSITIFGMEAKTVLTPRERYIVQRVNDNMETSNGNYYRAGGTELSAGIEEGLKQLKSCGEGRHKLLICITDASLDGGDRRKCTDMLRREMKHKDFSVMLYFIGSDEVVLGDDRYEARIKNTATDLVPEAVRLMKKIIAPVQW